MSVTITLAWPVSANRYWRSFVPRGGSRAIVTLSDEAKAYKRDVKQRLMVAGVRKPILGRVRVDILLYPGRPADAEKRMRKDPLGWDDTVRCIDLDNARKVLYDALKGLAFEDDARIFKDSAERMEPDGEARVVVTIAPIVRASPQASLIEEATPA